MQISVSKTDLYRGLRWVQGIVERKSTSPSLVNVLLSATGKNSLEISATDLTVSLTGRIPSIVSRQGSIVVNAKKAFEIVNTLPDGEIILESLEKNRLNIKCAKIEFKLHGASQSEFPTLPKLTSVKVIQLKRELLEGMISKTLYAASNEEMQRTLNGVLFEQDENGRIRMVATDGHRLALVESALKDGKSEITKVVIPRKGLTETKKVMTDSEEDIELGFLPNHVIFNTKEATLSCKLLEGKFPNYEQVIPQESTRSIKVGRNALLDSMKRMSILSADHSNIIVMKMSGGKLEVSSVDPSAGEGKEEIPIEYSETPMSVGLNARYFIEALNAMDSEEVKVEFVDELSAISLKPEMKEKDEKYNKHVCVIMPVRL